MTVALKNPPGVPAPVGPYSHVAAVTAFQKLLVLAGQVGQRLDGSFAESIEDQFDQALQNVLAIVASEGGDVRSIARLTFFLTDRPAHGSIAALLRKTFGGDLPPTTAVYVSSLYATHVKVEIEALAAV